MMIKMGDVARRVALVVGVSACLFSATGCSEYQANRQVDLDARHGAMLARTAAAPAPFRDPSSVRVSSEVYVGANAKPIGNDRMLPTEWRSRKVTFVEARFLDLREIADLLTATTHMPVSYAGGQGRMGQQARGSSQQADLTSRRVTLAPGGPVPAGFNAKEAEAIVEARSSSAASAPNEDSVPAGRMRVNFSGTLSQFLDTVAANFGLVWTTDGERIVFSTQETKVFDVPALPIVLKLSSSFDAGLNSSAAQGAVGTSTTSGGSQQSDTVSSTAAFELWKDINATLKSIVNGEGGVEVSGTAGTVTITGRPETVARVAAFVRELNRRLAKEVVLSLTVYSVVLDRQDNYALDLNAAFSKAAVGGTFATTGGAAALTSALANMGNQGLNFGILKGPFSGSNVVGQALSTIGNVSTVNSQSLTTVNGIPVPFQDVNIRGYVSQVSTTALVAGSSSAMTALTPSSVKTGFSLTMTPHVNNDGTILLSYALDMSELAGAVNGFDTFSSGGQMVQLPNINSRNFVQEAVIPVGSTLVVSGIELTRTSSQRSGVGSPDFPLFGGGRNSEAKREILVIAITPHIVDLGYGRASR